MQNQSITLLNFLNSVLTTTTSKVEYKTKQDSLLPNNLKRFFKLPLPDDSNKNVKKLLITTCEKKTLTPNEYFEHLSFQTEHFILDPFFEDDSLKIDLGNTDPVTEEDLKIAEVKKAFNKEREEEEKKAFKKIFEVEKNEIKEAHANAQEPYYEKLDDSLKIYSYFKNEYITKDLETLQAEDNVDTTFKEIIDYLFTEDRIKEDISKCAKLYFTKHTTFKDKELKSTEKNETDSEGMDLTNWVEDFSELFSKIITSEHLKKVKEYLKNTSDMEKRKNIKSIDDSLKQSIAKNFKVSIEGRYNELNSLQIGNYVFNDKNMKNITKWILRILKVQYSCFHEILTAVHKIARNTKQKAETINDFNETKIAGFKALLDDYKSAFECDKTVFEDKESIFTFIETLKAKFNENVEETNFKRKKEQLELFNALKGEQKVLQFTLIFDNSNYVYLGFYTFTGNDLKLIKNKAEEEVYKIINGLGKEGPRGPKGETRPKGKDGAAGVSEKTVSEQKAPFFASWPYQIFFLLYLISISGLVVYIFLMSSKHASV